MIPKVIHYCWFSEEKHSTLIKKCIASWRQILPDYELKWWGPDSFNFNSIPYVREAFERKKWAFVTDYVRLHALYHHGGIYLDTDVEVFKSFDRFLNNQFFSALEPSDYREDFNTQIEPAIMGSVKGDPYIKQCLDYYKDKLFINDDGSNNYYGIPLIMTDIAVEYGFDGHDREYILRDGCMHLYPTTLFSFAPSNKQSYAIHKYNGAWLDRGPVHGFFKRNDMMHIYRKLENIKNFFIE